MTLFEKYKQLNIDGALIGLEKGSETSDEYYEGHILLPQKLSKWSVYYSGNFWGHNKNERPGKEFQFNQDFTWDDESWLIPSIYVCGKGVVMDFCKKVEPEKIDEFLNKWIRSGKTMEDFPDEQMEQMESESPLVQHISFHVKLNGRELNWERSCSTCWNPRPSNGETNDAESKAVLLHYGLDPSMGWIFCRASFAWVTKRKPVMREIQVTLKSDPVAIAGPQFMVGQTGQEITLIHPRTSQQHTLTIVDCSQEQLPECHFHDENQEFPRCFTQLTYTLTPDLPNERFNVLDCSKSDQPQQKKQDLLAPISNVAVAIGIIGSADGPTAVFVPGKSAQNKQPHIACSSLHFSPVNNVQWRIVFREKLRGDTTVILNLTSVSSDF